MSYTRTLKDGTQKRYYTAKERALQETRKRNRRDYWLDERYQRRELRNSRINAHVSDIARWYSYAHLLRWYADALRSAYDIRQEIKADLRYKVTGQYSDDMSVGGLETARLRLNAVLDHVRYLETVIRAYLRIYGER